jgi:hypothetical protein
MKVSYKVEEDPQVGLAKLEYDYCLPKWFWTNREWNTICYYTIGYKNQIIEYQEYRVLCNKYEDENERINNG